MACLSYFHKNTVPSVTTQIMLAVLIRPPTDGACLTKTVAGSLAGSELSCKYSVIGMTFCAVYICMRTSVYHTRGHIHTHTHTRARAQRQCERSLSTLTDYLVSSQRSNSVMHHTCLTSMCAWLITSNLYNTSPAALIPADTAPSM